MQFHWLNKQNNDKLIIFFAGWSFDEKPFEFLSCTGVDVLMVYDYSTIDDDFEKFSSYKEINLIAWSMGVFVAYLLKDKFPHLNKRIAMELCFW